MQERVGGTRLCIQLGTTVNIKLMFIKEGLYHENSPAYQSVFPAWKVWEHRFNKNGIIYGHFQKQKAKAARMEIYS